MQSLISVIVPSYNHSRYVRETINSIYRQTYKNFEVIVIDDGSSDNSPELLTELQKKFGFKLILKKNEGVCKTLNHGLEQAQGDFITIIASDDIMPDDRLEKQVSAMNTYKDADVIAGGIQVLEEDGTLLNIKVPRTLGALSFEQMIFRNQIFAPTAVFKKSTFKKFGNYNADFVIEDLYYWLKVLSNNGKIINVSDIWAYYRTTHGNQDKRTRWYFKGIKQTLETYLDKDNVKKAIHKHTFTYIVKLAFINGIAVRKEQEFTDLNLVEQNIVTVVSLIPKRLRSYIYEFLLKYY